LAGDGFSLDDKRAPLPETNDIPDILSKWPNREEGKNSFSVPLKRIQDNGWKLMPARYKSRRIGKVKHDSPTDILSDVITLETEIAGRAKALRSVLQSK
jgi:type I restriction enzyme M protein